MNIYTEETAEYIWRNGNVIPWHNATVHVNAVGHASVSGVFEGIKAYWNSEEQQLYVFRLHDHMVRFKNSIKLVRYGFDYSVEACEEAVLDLLRANDYRRGVYIRPYVFQKGMVRELLQAQPGLPTEFVIDSWPFAAYSSAKGDRFDICVSSWTRIGDNVMPPRLKCFSNYQNGRLAALEANVSGYDWPVMLDSAGKVSEGPGACVALIRNGELIFPIVTSSILESVTRDTVMKIATQLLHMPVIERMVDRTELYIADEIFFAGTGWEIKPVTSVDRIIVGGGTAGPLTQRIADLYRAVVTGMDKRFPQWRTPVYN